MRYHKIPDETVRRLPIYLRGALHLSQQGVEGVSSETLAAMLGVHSWQIRKDFSYFGDFGKPGVGYSTETMIKRIKQIMHLDGVREIALVGVGNLGTALLTFPGFEMYGFRIVAAFDSNRRKIGRKKGGVTVEDVGDLRVLKERGVNLGIIAVPGNAAQEVAESMIGAGIRGILNFSPRYIVVPKRVKVITIDIAMDLARLPYYLPAG